MVYVVSVICETYLVQWYSIDLWSIGLNTGGLGICAFCYMSNLCGVVVFHRSMLAIGDGGYICPRYMCILLYVKLYLVQWYSIDLWSIGGEGGLGICAFCFMSNLCGVVVFHRSVVAIGMRVHLLQVYMHSGICETYLQCSVIPYIYGQLEQGDLGICAFCYM